MKATRLLLNLFGIILLNLFSLSYIIAEKDDVACNTSPVIICPQNYFGCPGDNISPDMTGFATATAGEADCESPEVTYTDLVISEGPCTGQKLVKRIWLAEYPNNSNPWLFAECTQIILLEDATDPVITNCPANITLDLTAGCDALATWNEPTADDNCGISSFTSNYASGTNFPEGVTNVIYTAKDNCGNKSTCSFTVTVNGNCCDAPPVITCPSNVDICIEDYTPNTQNCGDCFNDIVSSGIMAVSNDDKSFITYNPATDQLIKKVFPNLPAVYALGVNYNNPNEFYFASGTNIFKANYTLGTFIDLGSTGTAKIIAGLDVALNGDIYVVTVDNGVYKLDNNTYQATLLFTADISFTRDIVVIGNDEIWISGTSEIKRFDSAGNVLDELSILGSGNGNGLAFDGCDNAYFANESGIYSINIQSGDVSFLMNMANIPLYDLDTYALANSVSVPYFQEKDCNTGLEGAIVDENGNPYIPVGCTTAIDNCDAFEDNGNGNNGDYGNATAVAGASGCGQPVISSEDIIISTGPCTGQKKIKRIFTATDPDNAALFSTCEQIIDVRDIVPPTFDHCPYDITLTASSNSGGALANWTEPTVSDNCSETTISANFWSGDVFPVGTSTVVYTAADACGNTAQCSFKVTVETAGHLDLHCPADLTIDCNSNLSDVWTAPTFTTDCTECQDGYIPGFIYMGSKNGSQFYCSIQDDTWEHAQLVCQNYGGYLATISNAEENWFLSNFLNVNSAYIGLNDAANEGNFVWDSGEQLSYQNWYPGQPNDYLNDQDYVELLKNGQWNDQYGHKKLEFIMEIPCVDVYQSGGPNVNSNLNPGTYTISYEAQDACGNTDWCSFNLTVETSISIECPANVVLTCPYNSSGVVVNWNTPTATTCCSYTSQHIPGYVYMGEYNGSNYYCSLSPATWTNASNACSAWGGNLATINSAGENSFLASKLQASSAYIGLSDAWSEGNFTWSSGQPMTYSNWYPGQPNNFNNGQDYVELLSNGQWNDQYNYKPLEYIMEIPSSVSVTQIAGPHSGSVFPKGSVTTITYKATDACGNWTTCSFTITITGEDCNPVGMNGELAWIDEIQFGNYVNHSGNNWGYADFTSTCTNVWPGSSYNLKLDPGFNQNTTAFWKIYIDFNMDGDFFDAGEFVAYGSSPGTILGMLTMPYNVWEGNATMRIIMQAGSYPSGPCDNSGYGEIEEYCLHFIADLKGDDVIETRSSSDTEPILLTAVNAEEINVYPNPTSDKVFISNNNVDKVEVYTIDGRLIKTVKQEKEDNMSIDLSNSGNGVYMLRIYTKDNITPTTKKVILSTF